MRCLEKDRARRYETAIGLAQDIERYLTDEPVEARRPTPIYRVQKFVRRNKAGVLAATAIVAALLSGLSLATIGFVQARRQAELARTQAARSDRVAQFLKDVLKAADVPELSQMADQDEIFDRTSLIATAKDPSDGARRLRLRGTLLARVGRWDEAAADCLEANKLCLDGGEFSFDAAIVLMKTGHNEAYRQLCHAYLQRVGDKPSYTDADMAAKASLLLPVGGADFKRACELADFAATETEPPWHVACDRLGKALAEYRRGQFEEAVDWTNRAISSVDITPRHKATAFFIQACGSARLGRLDSARTALQKGDELLPQDTEAAKTAFLTALQNEDKLIPQRRNVFSSTFGDTWCDWAIAEFLRGEATDLLANEPNADAKSVGRD